MASKLSIRPIFDYEKVEYNKTSEVHLDVILEASEKEGEKRTPIQMVLALDCSGSMSGVKLDSVKSTVSKLIDHLTENDTVGIIGFSTNVFDVSPVLPMTAENRKTAKNSVQALHAMSSTNISDALVMAWEKAITAEKDKISRVVLLTDGLPNHGVSTREGLVELIGKMNQKVSLSCFGYGTDYDPELLTSLANIGKGNNFYIESDSDCRKAFALELGGLLSICAQDIKILIAPSGNMVMKELVSSYEYENKPGYRGITSGKMSITVDDIYYGEKKHIILKMEIPQATEAVCARPSRVCDVNVDYLDTESNERVKLEGSAKIQYVKIGQAQEKANEEVKKQLMMFEAARIQKEAKEKADAGDFEAARVILGEAVTWAKGNSWYENSGALVSNFSLLAENCMDRFSYSTKGSKLANSYLRSYTTGRGSSGDTVCCSYTSGTQLDMLNSFSENPPKATAAPSDIVKIVVPEPEKGEEKK